jgi:DNA-binding IclR family transcriptional regulator
VATPKTRKNDSGPVYNAPALEKGLDILELLATEPEVLMQSQVAERLSRSPSEIFRMLTTLVERGYLARRPDSGAYYLTLKLFELSHNHDPTIRLLETALPKMRRLAIRTEQSCHLSVLNSHHVLVVGQAESQTHWQFIVRLGATIPAATCASGKVLLAFALDVQREAAFTAMKIGRKSPAYRELLETLHAVTTQGYEHTKSEAFDGIEDISFPIFDYTGAVIAALTMPVVSSRLKHVEVDAIIEDLKAVAQSISHLMGGRHPVFDSDGQ